MPKALRFERTLSAPNEVFASDEHAFAHYRPVLEEMGRMGAGGWERGVHRAHAGMLEEQLGVGVSGGDKTHPTDYFPRVIPARGLADARARASPSACSP